MTVTVWFVAVVFVAVLWWRRADSFEFVGLAQAREYPVSTHSGGTVASLRVDLYETVEPGQLLARLDETALLARLDTARAMLDASRGQLEMTAANLGFQGAGLDEELRRFQIDEQELHLEMLSIRVNLEDERIEQDRLELERNRMRNLVESGVRPAAELEDIELLCQQVDRRLVETQELYDRTEEAFVVARDRRERFEEKYDDLSTGGALDGGLAETLQLRDLRIREIEAERLALSLRAPVRGQVSRIDARPGQSILPGQPIVTVTEAVASELVAYLPQEASHRVHENQIALTARASDPRHPAETYVMRVGPAIEELPRQLWMNPSVPEYGRPILLASTPALGLMPGEVVRVGFSSRRNAEGSS